MTIRTIRRTVTFRKPFVLGKSDERLPAGDYVVETDEKLLSNRSFAAFRHIQTVMHRHAKSSSAEQIQTLKISPDELEAAFRRDRATVEALDAREIAQKSSKPATV